MEVSGFNLNYKARNKELMLNNQHLCAENPTKLQKESFVDAQKQPVWLI